MRLSPADSARVLIGFACGFLLLAGVVLWLKREVDVLYAAVTVLIRRYEALKTELDALRARRAGGASPPPAGGDPCP